MKNSAKFENNLATNFDAEIQSKAFYPSTKESATFLATKNIVLIAIIAASLIVLKLALFIVPNIEVVTVLILAYSTVFGKKTALSALIFCAVEISIYGFGMWTMLYFLYWCPLSLIASVLLKKASPFLAVILAIISTIWFGVLDAIIYTIFSVAGGVEFPQMLIVFGAYYARGIWFCVTHIVSNAIVVAALYKPLVAVLCRIKK